LSDVNKIEFFIRIFKKHKNIKFHKNLSGGSRVVPCGRTDGQTNITNKSLFAILHTRLINGYLFMELLQVLVVSTRDVNNVLVLGTVKCSTEWSKGFHASSVLLNASNVQNHKFIRVLSLVLLLIVSLLSKSTLRIHVGIFRKLRSRMTLIRLHLNKVNIQSSNTNSDIN